MSPFGDIKSGKGEEEVRNVASDLVIAILVVIMVVLLALRFF
jgi:multidrug efflux pump subunit AcrB